MRPFMPRKFLIPLLLAPVLLLGACNLVSLFGFGMASSLVFVGSRSVASAPPGEASAFLMTPTPTPAVLMAMPTPTPAVVLMDVERLVPQVIETRPHDTSSFTEGFELVDGVLFESAGHYGQSTMRRTDPETGAVLTSVPLEPQYFAEGISVVGDKVLQMTWKESTVFVYDKDTLEAEGTLPMTGEGWGMCYDGRELWQSDGSTVIRTRNPETFEETGHIVVTYQGQPTNMLNELECVGDQIYANVWMTNYIIRIDKATGVIDAVIDASGLLTPAETAAAGDQGVLNGIAYNAEADTFLITGKLWPKTFEVTFVPE